MFQNEGRLETVAIRFFNVFGLLQRSQWRLCRRRAYVKDIAGALAFAVESHRSF